MDLVAPLIHEFTYQAMAHDLLPIRDEDKVTFKTTVHKGEPDESDKDVEISEKDKIWVENRHRHMKDTIEKLMGDFNKFIDENPHFTNSEGDATSLNAIKDMLAGLPQFQEKKEEYSLHLTMAQECMDKFQKQKLPDIASVEQSLATGLDEDYRKPKNLADQMVRLLDDENIDKPDRLRLILLYIIFRDGLVLEDIQKLLAHANLSLDSIDPITNMELLGVRPTKALKDSRTAPQPVFPRKTAPTAENEDYALSRFEPMVKLMLENVTKGTLEQATFPYTKPPLDNSEELAAQAQTSLRSAKPTWARNRMSTAESRQRIIVFMAGGATYSESRSCYEVSRTSGRDIFLATSHMLSPNLFVRQVGDLNADRRKLDLPIDRPKPKAPAHLFERNDPPRPVAPQGPKQAIGLPTSNRSGALPKSPGASQPPSKTYDARLVPTAGLAAMSMNSSGGKSLNGTDSGGHAKLEKKSKKGEDGEKKKHRHFGFGSKK
jgi:syntaxin-binding protein 1